MPILWQDAYQGEARKRLAALQRRPLLRTLGRFLFLGSLWAGVISWALERWLP